MIKRFCIETATIKERERVLTTTASGMMMSGMISGLLHTSWSLWGHPGNSVNKLDRLTDTEHEALLVSCISSTSDHCTDRPDNFVGTFICYQAVSNDGR